MDRAAGERPPPYRLEPPRPRAGRRSEGPFAARAATLLPFQPRLGAPLAPSSPACPFCKGAVPVDTLRFGGNCPHCILEIPGEEAPTDPGLPARQRKQQEEQIRAVARTRRNRILGALAFVAVAALAGVGVWQHRAQQAVLVYDVDEYYATPLSELEGAPVAPLAAAEPKTEVAGRATPESVGTTGRRKQNPALAVTKIGGGTADVPAMKRGSSGGSGDLAVLATVTAGAERSSTGLGTVDIGVTRLGTDRVLSDEQEIYDMVKRVLSANGAQARACYDQRLKQVEGLRGAWDVSFTIAKDGTTKGVRIKAVNAADAELEGCLERSVKSWKFQKIYEEKPVSKPFRFGGASL